MSEKTLFTRIIEGEIPGDFVHRDDRCVVIRDIQPQAPTHLLVIPIKPIGGVQHAEAEDRDLLGHGPGRRREAGPCGDRIPGGHQRRSRRGPGGSPPPPPRDWRANAGVAPRLDEAGARSLYRD